MDKLIIVSILLLAGICKAQTITENYIETKAYLEPITNTSTTAKQIRTVQYLDGLGRPKQVVNVKTSPTGKDVVVHIEYDQYGIPAKQYLPVPQSNTLNGDIYSFPLGNSNAIYGAEKIYSEKIFEQSPLNRIQQKIQVGNDWSSHPVNYTYDTNNTGDYVKKYDVTTIWDNTNKIFHNSVQSQQYYQPNELYKTSVKDEDQNKTVTFSNKFGQTVLVRKEINSSENADTYYAYNMYDQLVYIIPPLAAHSQNFGPDILNDLCYQYSYDVKNRLIEKKIPGKDWEYMLYDMQDRLVAAQDPNLREKGQWMYTKYDQFGRIALTGLSTGSTRKVEQDIVDGTGPNNVIRANFVVFNSQGMNVYYDNPDATYPEPGKWIELLTVHYFDTYPPYNFNPALPNSIINQPTLTDNSTANNSSTKSLPVLSLIKNIEDDNWTKNYNSYDRRGRVIGTYSINHLGGYTKNERELDFAGYIKQSKVYHKRTPLEIEKYVAEKFDYDSQNRIKKHWHQVDGISQELLSDNTYNELSELINKKVGGTVGVPLQSIDYQYNIRGWLSKINDPQNLSGKLFGYEMKYQAPANASSVPKYNGNISEIDWKTANGSILKRYYYQYDGINRLNDAIYVEPSITIPPSNNYGESVTYDINGNIKTLKRFNGFIGSPMLIDDLNYTTYKGNQLIKVTENANNGLGYPSDGGNIIDYDLNGNMINHIDKGINLINYNFLNLPSDINLNSNNLKFKYRADGVKIQKSYSWFSPRVGSFITNITDYLDDFQYVGTILEFYPTSEGYYDFQNNRYVYNYLDQVGNIRLAYYKNETGTSTIDKETNFYPFGMEYFGPNGTYPLNRSYNYGFQGQEKQEETGWSSFKWRNYDSALGRFFNVDPLSERYSYQSHYNFSENRVVNSRELEGLEAYDNNESADDDDYGNKGGWVGVDFGAFDGKNISRDEFDWIAIMKQNIEGGIPGVDVSWKVLDLASKSDAADENKSLSWLGIYDKGEYQKNASEYEDWTRRTGADEIENQAYWFFGSAFAAPFVMGEVAAYTGVSSAAAYLESAAIRFTADVVGQNIVNGGVTNPGQTLINTIVGGGSSATNQVITAVANTVLNTANNVSTSSSPSNLVTGGVTSLIIMTAASQGAPGNIAGTILYETGVQTVANGASNVVNQEVK